MQSGHKSLDGQTGTKENRTAALSRWVSRLEPADLSDGAKHAIARAVLDGSGALIAATNPVVDTGRAITGFAADTGGDGPCSLIGEGRFADAVSAALANGTLGYACDVEPFHPGGVLHPISCILPTAIAAAELGGKSGAALLAAVALGCEVTYRVSIALGPVEQYDLGFHPSAVCGVFGTTAAAARLLDLDEDATERALGLAACQASGLMAWESDPTENARPFQMGMAARNGMTAALLARLGFGGPRAVFDNGHTVFGAFSRAPMPEKLCAGLGDDWRGVTELALKPYPCVAFLHPGLDAMLALRSEHGLTSRDVRRLRIHFARSGAHCIDGNPLKSHSAQYVLAVAFAAGRLTIADLFQDRRGSDAEVRRLADLIEVVWDDGELERAFPARYATLIEIETADGCRLERRQDIARGYPDAPLSDDDLTAKLNTLLATVGGEPRVEKLVAAVAGLWAARDVAAYAAVLRERAA